MSNIKPEGICSLESCTNPLGPDCLSFEHKGKTAGGICEICLASVAAVRVLFVKDGDGIFHPEEMVSIDKLTS